MRQCSKSIAKHQAKSNTKERKTRLDLFMVEEEGPEAWAIERTYLSRFIHVRHGRPSDSYRGMSRSSHFFTAQRIEMRPTSYLC